MKGDYVIAKAFGGRPLTRRVWEATSETVYICTDERYGELLDGKENCHPIGFPREYVFEYDSGMASELESQWRLTPELWDNLAVWNEGMSYEEEG